ncbi:hypothetical protein BGW41_002837, partial [Actinomortierella wolfii]
PEYAQVARHFGVSPSTIRSIVVVFEEAGRVAPKKRGGNRTRRVLKEHIEFLAKLMDANPAITNKELHQQVNDQFDLKNPPLSMTAVSKAAHSLTGYTLKILQHEPEDFNSADRIVQRQPARPYLPLRNPICTVESFRLVPEYLKGVPGQIADGFRDCRP